MNGHKRNALVLSIVAVEQDQPHVIELPLLELKSTTENAS